MRNGTLPLIILAGGDRTPTQLPESGADKHPLSGLKGIDIRLGDRSLVDLLLERLHEIGRFGPIYIAGPVAVYGESRQGARVIDTDGGFGDNIRTSLTAVMQDHPEGAVGLITCDVLPDRQELERQLDDFEAHRPLAFWFAMILAPESTEALGTSSWKPQYRVVQDATGEAVQILPGHLIIVEPSRWRLDIAYRTFALAFNTRNRPVTYRLWFIVRHILVFLLRKDLGRLLRLQPPTLTCVTLYHAIRIGTKLRQGTISASEMADRFVRIFVKAKDQRESRGRIVVMEAMTMAKDIDTFEEAEEMSRKLGLG
ncbi:MAG: hypothetical protein AAF657_39265 [Acidobacteriota bacterium]